MPLFEAVTVGQGECFIHFRVTVRWRAACHMGGARSMSANRTMSQRCFQKHQDELVMTLASLVMHLRARQGVERGVTCVLDVNLLLKTCYYCMQYISNTYLL